METKTIATNKKAFHNYYIGETLEAGIALLGSEIKSIRNGAVSLGDAYVHPEKGELWLLNAHIARYDASGISSHEPMRRMIRALRDFTFSPVSKNGCPVPLRASLDRSRAVGQPRRA